MQLSLLQVRAVVLAVFGATLLSGFVVGWAQADGNLPPIWEPWKWLALDRELGHAIPNLEKEESEFVRAMKQDQGREEERWTKSARTTKTK